MPKEVEDNAEGSETIESGEGAVDWEAAEEFLSGQEDGVDPEDDDSDDDGDDPDTGDEEAQPELVEVRLRGHTLMLPPEQAAAIEEYRRENRERDGRLGGQISQYQERLARLEAIQAERDRLAMQATEDAPRRPDPELALRDFPKWEQQWAEYQQYEQAKLIHSLETRYVQEREAEKRALAIAQRNEAWANSFYTSNPHLNKPVLKPVVAAVFRENQQELESYGDDYGAAFHRLAQLTDARVKEIMSLGKPNPNRAPSLEASGSRAPKKPASKPTPDFTMSDWSARKRAQAKE